MKYKFVFEEKKKGWITFSFLAFLAFGLLLSLFGRELIGAVIFAVLSLQMLISCLKIEVQP